LTASGGNPPYKWSVIGSLPPGLDIHKKLGRITGRPQASGTYSFTVAVTDSRTAAPPHTQRVAAQSLSITVQ
jgi:large repetitive protein